MVMSPEIGLSAAFLAGLMGSGHCVGMCGGIVAALNVRFENQLQPAKTDPKFHALSYHAGRILSYALIGLLAGYLGAALFDLFDPVTSRIIAALFLIALGLYIANWWRGLALTEKWGSVIWKRIEPFTRTLIPVSNYRQAFVLGLLWGWLPCGLVYAMVIWALASGSPLHSAGLMIAFGLGTLPALLVTGKLFHKLGKWVRSDRFRAVAGSIIIAFGVLALHHALMTRFGDHGGHTTASSTTRPAPVSSSRAPAILRKLW